MSGKGAELRLLLLHDGRKGHLSQTRGLADAIERRFRCSREEILAKPRPPFAMKLLRLLAGRAPRMVAACYRFREPAAKPDLILSFGGKVAPLNVALAHRHDARNINIGSLRQLNPEWFSAVISLAGLPGVANSIASGGALTRVNRETLAGAGGGAWPTARPLWLLLFGGEGSGYRFSARELRELGGQLNRIAEERGIRWLLSTSPRTGAAAEALLRAVIRRQVLADAIWYGATPERDLLPMLAAAERIFCSADSMTMLHESLASGKPVTAWFGRKRPRTGKALADLRALQELARTGRLTLASIEELHEAPPPKAGSGPDRTEQLLGRLQQLGALPASPD